MPLAVPVIADKSVAVMDWVPLVFSVALKLPLPVIAESPGSTAWPSLLLKLTLVLYPETVLLKASFAVTVNRNEAPAVCGEPALTRKWLVAAGEMTSALLVPLTAQNLPLHAVMVWLPAVRKDSPVKVCTPRSPATKM